MYLLLCKQSDPPDHTPISRNDLIHSNKAWYTSTVGVFLMYIVHVYHHWFWMPHITKTEIFMLCWMTLFTKCWFTACRIYVLLNTVFCYCSGMPKLFHKYKIIFKADNDKNSVIWTGWHQNGNLYFITIFGSLWLWRLSRNVTLSLSVWRKWSSKSVTFLKLNAHFEAMDICIYKSTTTVESV